MAKVIDIESRLVSKEHVRKDARAKALQDSLRNARQEALTSPVDKSLATTKLLAVFRTKKPQKPSAPTRRK
jgi:hypothetical protein